MTPESIVLRQVKDYLQRIGWDVVRNQQNIGSTKGIADFICTKDGHTVWIECKAPAHFSALGRYCPPGKPTPDQLKFQHRIVLHGGAYIFVHGIEDMIEKFRTIGVPL